MSTIDDENLLPFAIKISESSPFIKALTKAINHHEKSKKSLLESHYDISTMSANIMLKSEDLNLKVSEIKKKYGTNFSIRKGTTFEVPY